ncbi:MAG: hypothetical protein V3U87_17830 [Methylococcaceae bacterium]
MKPMILKSCKPNLSSDDYYKLIGEEIDRVDDKIMTLFDESTHEREKEIDRLTDEFGNMFDSYKFAKSGISDEMSLYSSRGLVLSGIFVENCIDISNEKSYRRMMKDASLAASFFGIKEAKKLFSEGNIKGTLYVLESVNHYSGLYIGMTTELMLSSKLGSLKGKMAAKQKDRKIQPLRDFVKAEYLKGCWKTDAAASLELDDLVKEFMAENNLTKPVPTNRTRWIKDLMTEIKKKEKEK